MTQWAEIPAETQVLIVGGGPTGLLMSILLSQQGISNVVVERKLNFQQSPAAHVVNARTFEICRSAGIDMEKVEAISQDPAEGAWVRWSSSLGKGEVGKVPFEGQHHFDELFATSPYPLRNLSQHLFEPLLASYVKTLVHGAMWVSSLQDNDGVSSVIRDTQSNEEKSIRSSYVIGCDGARSALRDSTSITMDGPDELQSFIMIHATTDLGPVVGDSPATLYFITNPEIRSTFIAHDISKTWVLMKEWNSETEPMESFTTDKAREIFCKAAGISLDYPLEISNVGNWRMSCQIASKYSEGRIFIAGDAAHRFPPTGGLGLNTGAGDVHNLAWKLAFVLKGIATEDLLETYEAERKPVADRNAQVSLDNAFRLFEVWISLGVTDDVEESKANEQQILSTQEGRDAVQVAVANQAEHFDQLGLQLGYSYEAASGLVVDDGSEEISSDNPVRNYVATMSPGARIPHIVMKKENRDIALHDLVKPGHFLLVSSNDSWIEAADEFSLPITTVYLGKEVVDPTGVFESLAQIGENGALLVRPDQHVAFRTKSSDAPAASLQNTFTTLKGF